METRTASIIDPEVNQTSRPVPCSVATASKQGRASSMATSLMLRRTNSTMPRPSISPLPPKLRSRKRSMPARVMPCASVLSASSRPVAWEAATSAPLEQPHTTSMGTPIASRASSAQMWLQPRALPAPRTTPTRRRSVVGSSALGSITPRPRAPGVRVQGGLEIGGAAG